MRENGANVRILKKMIFFYDVANAKLLMLKKSSVFPINLFVALISKK